MFRTLHMGGCLSEGISALVFSFFIHFLLVGCIDVASDEGLGSDFNGNIPGAFSEDAGPAWTPPAAVDAQGGVESNPVPGDDDPSTEKEEIIDETDPKPEPDPYACPGGFLCPCEGNADCLSGYCVPSPEGLVCNQPCLDECPNGWTCEALLGEGPDIVFFCMPSFPQLCQPCTSSAECQAIGNEDALCVVYGEDSGQFCGNGCVSDQQCPEGYFCSTMVTAEGTPSQQCQLEGAEECPCEPAWEGLATPCASSNDAGLCVGSRTCIDGWLTECDAAQPAVEVCDGIDNDCDGLTDEDLCDDSVACTVDQCVPDIGCVHEVVDSFCPEGTVCKNSVCDVSEGCTLVPLTGKACDDGSVCTLEDACNNGDCTGSPLDCNDDNVCTIDSCSALEGCLTTANTAGCDDGNVCTLEDACSNSQCVSSGTLACLDGNSCTDDLCDAAAGCVFSPNGDGCNDGNACTLNDTCGGGSCVGGAAKTCNDGNSCTIDSCNPGSGCTFSNNSTGCNDGNACTVNDHCSGGACVGGGSKGCNDGNNCTNDSCSPNSGCVFANNGNGCNDGNACTLSDFCSGGTCKGSGAKNCDDGDSCTADSCSPSFGCQHTTIPGCGYDGGGCE